jgi:hypothetical protein
VAEERGEIPVDEDENVMLPLQVRVGLGGDELRAVEGALRVVVGGEYRAVAGDALHECRILHPGLILS